MIAERFGFIHRGSLVSEISAGELSEAGQKNICIKTPRPSKALQVIQDTFHITVVSRYEGEEICIPVEKVSLENIISVLIKNNIEIQNISTSSPNLENYYMNLIRGENK
jgi:ABC-2 type transport system ATP-binding protein